MDGTTEIVADLKLKHLRTPRAIDRAFADALRVERDFNSLDHLDDLLEDEYVYSGRSYLVHLTIYDASQLMPSLRHHLESLLQLATSTLDGRGGAFQVERVR